MEFVLLNLTINTQALNVKNEWFMNNFLKVSGFILLHILYRRKTHTRARRCGSHVQRELCSGLIFLDRKPLDVSLHAWITFLSNVNPPTPFLLIPNQWDEETSLRAHLHGVSHSLKITYCLVRDEQTRNSCRKKGVLLPEARRRRW